MKLFQNQLVSLEEKLFKAKVDNMQTTDDKDRSQYLIRSTSCSGELTNEVFSQVELSEMPACQLQMYTV